jgi:hypothetical protein
MERRDAAPALGSDDRVADFLAPTLIPTIDFAAAARRSRDDDVAFWRRAIAINGKCVFLLISRPIAM